MNGFGLKKLNDIPKIDTFVKMRGFLISCCDLMNKNCINENNCLPNHEEKIRNRLVFSYLNESMIRKKLGYCDIKLSFDAETSGNYDDETDTANARLDIKVTSEDTLAYPEKYYTIECKRLDGYTRLNRDYVTQGIARFVSHDAKYSSDYGKNMMLGFMVRQVDIKQNAKEINTIQNNELEKETIKKEMFIIKEKTSHCIYEAEYLSPYGEIKLQHLFYDFSSAICTKK